MSLQLEKLVKFEFLLFLLCLRFVQNISVYGTDERVKLDFDLNKTPQENGMMEGHSKAYVDITGKQNIDKSVEGTKPFKPKRRSPRIEPFLNEQGECILHRPKCDHWKDLNPSERRKEHGKFNRMIMTPEERQKDRERLSRIPKDPEKNARYNKKWYKKKKGKPDRRRN